MKKKNSTNGRSLLESLSDRLGGKLVAGTGQGMFLIPEPHEGAAAFRCCVKMHCQGPTRTEVQGFQALHSSAESMTW